MDKIHERAEENCDVLREFPIEDVIYLWGKWKIQEKQAQSIEDDKESQVLVEVSVNYRGSGGSTVGRTIGKALAGLTGQMYFAER
jgi:hypothetical protein